MVGSSDSAFHYGSLVLRLARAHKVEFGEAMGLFALSQVYGDIERADSLIPLAAQAITICQRVGCWFTNELIALAARFFAISPTDMSTLQTVASRAQAAGDTGGLAALYDAMGSVYTEQLHRYDSALVYYGKAMRLGRPTFLTVYGIGRAFRGLEMPDSAYSYFRVMELGARQSGDLRSEGYALGNIGGVCHRDFKPPRLGCALAYYDSAASVASQVLRQAGRDMNRIAYGEQASQIYSEWPFAMLSLGDTLGNQTASIAVRRVVNVAALAIAELGRSEALRDLMEGLRTRQRIPPLGAAVGTLGEQLTSMLPAGGATLSYLIRVDTILAWLTLPTKDLHVYRWAVAFDSLRAMVLALRSSLGADDALAGSRLRGTSVPTRDAHSLDPKMLDLAARRLAGVLIPDDLGAVLPPGSDLVVVPQNVLNLVPFAILPMRGGSTLGEHYAIRYTPSLISNTC
jgi:hypothetical protein